MYLDGFPLWTTIYVFFYLSSFYLTWYMLRIVNVLLKNIVGRSICASLAQEWDEEEAHAVRCGSTRVEKVPHLKWPWSWALKDDCNFTKWGGEMMDQHRMVGRFWESCNWCGWSITWGQDQWKLAKSCKASFQINPLPIISITWCFITVVCSLLYIPQSFIQKIHRVWGTLLVIIFASVPPLQWVIHCFWKVV